MHGRDFSDEAELHVRGHGHGQTLRVQKVRSHPLRLQPHLVLSAWKAKHSRLNGRAVSVRDEDKSCYFSGHTVYNVKRVCVCVPGTLCVLLYVTVEMKTLLHHSLYTRGRIGQVARQLLFRLKKCFVSK